MKLSRKLFFHEETVFCHPVNIFALQSPPEQKVAKFKFFSKNAAARTTFLEQCKSVMIALFGMLCWLNFKRLADSEFTINYMLQLHGWEHRYMGMKYIWKAWSFL